MKKLLIFIACFILLAISITMPIVVTEDLTEEEYKTLEIVVIEAYNSNEFLIEVPEDINLKKSNSLITADMTGHYGKVEGKMVNNEFQVTRVNTQAQDILIYVIGSIFIVGFIVSLFVILKFSFEFALFFAD